MIRKLILLQILLCFAGILLSCRQVFSQPMFNDAVVRDSVSPAQIELMPAEIIINDKERLVQKEVKVLNRGGSTLSIKKITSSCGCSSGKILKGKVEPMDIGKLIFSINLDGLYDERNEVQFIIESNASNSPTGFKVKVMKGTQDTNEVNSPVH